MIGEQAPTVRGVLRTVLVKVARDEHRRLLAAVGTLAPLIERGHVFATFREAVAHAATHLTTNVALVPAPVAAQSDEHTPVVI